MNKFNFKTFKKRKRPNRLSNKFRKKTRKKGITLKLIIIL